MITLRFITRSLAIPDSGGGGGSPANWTLVQTNEVEDGTAGHSTLVLVLTNNPTPGNTVAIPIFWYYAATPPIVTSILDSNGNSYAVSSNSPSVNDSNAGLVMMAYLLNAPANATKTITITFGGPFIVAAAWGIEVNRGSGGASFDSDNKGTGTGSIVNTPTASVTAIDFLVEVCAYSSGLTSVDSPWAEIGTTHFGARAGYKLNAVANTASAYTGDSGTSTWSSMTLSIK